MKREYSTHQKSDANDAERKRRDGRWCAGIGACITLTAIATWCFAYWLAREGEAILAETESRLIVNDQEVDGLIEGLKVAGKDIVSSVRDGEQQPLATTMRVEKDRPPQSIWSVRLFWVGLAMFLVSFFVGGAARAQGARGPLTWLALGPSIILYFVLSAIPAIPLG